MADYPQTVIEFRDQFRSEKDHRAYCHRQSSLTTAAGIISSCI